MRAVHMVFIILILQTILLHEASSSVDVAYELIAQICDNAFDECLYECEQEHGEDDSPNLRSCFHDCQNEKFDCNFLMFHF